jgi:agmatinase
VKIERDIWGGLDGENRSLQDAQVAVLGIPFDSAACFRRGSAFGPQKIREMSKRCHPLTERFVDTSGLKVCDLGDVDVDALDIPTTYARIDRQVQDIVHAGATPIVLGGDHSITFPVVRALHNHHAPRNNHHASHQPMGVIWFDAHPDLMHTYDGSKYSHACPLRRILELEHVQPEHVVMIGIRKVEPPEYEFMQETGIYFVHASEVARHPADAIAEGIRQRLAGVPRVYWSFDIDVLDPAFAPGTGVPTPAGLTTRQLFDLAYALRDLPLTGMDVVEVAPPFDHADITSFAAATLVMEMFGVIKGQQLSGSVAAETREIEKAMSKVND